MDLSFFERQLSNVLAPKEKYENLNNAIFDKTFENAPNVYRYDSLHPIEYEREYGSGKFERVEVGRIDSNVQLNTGVKSGDDYKVFYFKPDSGIKLETGRKFRWKNNIWLVQNTANKTADVSSRCVVIRCNNVLRYFDQKGNKIYEPCHIDDMIRFTRNNQIPDIPVSRGEYIIIVQRNKRTELLKPNDRFLFGTPSQRSCIRLYGSGIRNYINTYTEQEDSAGLTYLYGEHDQYNTELDDFVNGFANNRNSNDTSTETSKNGSVVLITPNLDTILEGNEQVFEVYLYDNGEQQPNTFEILNKSIKVPSDKYEFNVIDGNHFSIKNIEMFIDNPIIVTCTSNEFGQSKTIKLGGMW